MEKLVDVVECGRRKRLQSLVMGPETLDVRSDENLLNMMTHMTSKND